MNISINKLIATIIIALGGGVTATWYFSSSESLSRPIRDGLGMLALFTSLAIAGILIVVVLIRIDTNQS
jgi:hypothetical protein